MNDGFGTLIDWAGAAAEGVSSTNGRGILAWCIGGVLLWSGTGKLRTPTTASLTMSDFGVTKRPQRWHGQILGAIEATLGVALLLQVWPFIFGATAAVLFVTFVLLISRSLARDEEFSCACFGEASASLSMATLGRALVLTGAAAIYAVSASQSGLSFDLYEVLQAIGGMSIIAIAYLASQSLRAYGAGTVLKNAMLARTI